MFHGNDSDPSKSPMRRMLAEEFRRRRKGPPFWVLFDLGAIYPTAAFIGWLMLSVGHWYLSLFVAAIVFAVLKAALSWLAKQTQRENGVVVISPAWRIGRWAYFAVGAGLIALMCYGMRDWTMPGAATAYMAAWFVFGLLYALYSLVYKSL